MNKNDLIEKLHEKIGGDREVAVQAVETLFEILKSELKEGKQIKIRNVEETEPIMVKGEEGESRERFTRKEVEVTIKHKDHANTEAGRNETSKVDAGWGIVNREPTKYRILKTKEVFSAEIKNLKANFEAKYLNNQMFAIDNRLFLETPNTIFEILQIQVGDSKKLKARDFLRQRGLYS